MRKRVGVINGKSYEASRDPGVKTTRMQISPSKTAMKQTLPKNDFRAKTKTDRAVIKTGTTPSGDSYRTTKYSKNETDGPSAPQKETIISRPKDNLFKTTTAKQISKHRETGYSQSKGRPKSYLISKKKR